MDIGEKLMGYWRKAMENLPSPDILTIPHCSPLDFAIELNNPQTNDCSAVHAVNSAKMCKHAIILPKFANIYVSNRIQLLLTYIALNRSETSSETRFKSTQESVLWTVKTVSRHNQANNHTSTTKASSEKEVPLAASLTRGRIRR